MRENSVPTAPAALRLKPGEDSETIRRLRDIKPGEVIMYYRGSTADENSEATPRYSQLLAKIHGAARQLEMRGLAVLSKTKISQKKDDPTGRTALFEFTATGIEPLKAVQ
jgi:hypothetical protein